MEITSWNDGAVKSVEEREGSTHKFGVPKLPRMSRLLSKKSFHRGSDASIKRQFLSVGQELEASRLTIPAASTTKSGPWSESMVLCLEGNGWAGLVQLHIIKFLMIEIVRLEKERRAVSSLDPLILHRRRSGQIDRSAECRQDLRNVPVPENSELVLESDHTFLPCHYFDYIAGSNAGGLVAIMLGRLQMPVDEAIRVFKKFASRTGKVLYHRRLGRTPLAPGAVKSKNRRDLKEILEEEMSHSDPQRLLFSRLQKKLFLDNRMCKSLPLLSLRGKNNHQALLGPDQSTTLSKVEMKEVDVIDATLATLATSEQFDSVNIGGERFNGVSSVPSGLASKVVTTLKSPEAGGQQIGFLLNLVWEKTETMIRRRSFSPQPITQFKRIEAAADARLLQASLEEAPGNHTIRIQEVAGIPANWESGDVEEVAKFVVKFTENICAGEIKDELHECAKNLVDIRQERAQTRHWERFALGTHYECTLCEESKQERFDEQYALIDHLQSAHDMPPLNEFYYNDYVELLRGFRCEVVE